MSARLSPNTLCAPRFLLGASALNCFFQVQCAPRPGRRILPAQARPGNRLAAACPAPPPHAAWRRACRCRNNADSDAAVVLLGETGTGKERVAHAIREASAREEGPFVAVDCAGMAETLSESELFGYDKGAFTGAGHRKPGLLEAASGGTLFLDEIGELPYLTEMADDIPAVSPTRPDVFRIAEVLDLGSVERRYIDWAKSRPGSDPASLAEKLGISQRTPYRKLQGGRHGVKTLAGWAFSVFPGVLPKFWAGGKIAFDSLS